MANTPPTLRLTALALIMLTLGACDLPGSHPGDAAVVNGHVVPRSRWDHVVQVTTQQLENHVHVDLNSDTGRGQVRNLQTQALRAVIREQLIEDFARRQNIVLTDADLDRQVAQVTESLGGQAALNKRLDQTSETMADVRHTLRINVLQSRLRAASSTYDRDFEKALKDAQVTAYVPPCDGDHTWPQCAGGER